MLLDFPIVFVIVVGTQVKHDVVENSAQVSDLVVLHLHLRNSQGFLVLLCNEMSS